MQCSQANRFFTFISDTYETSSIIFTTNKEIMDWAEMMGDPVLTTALLDRILHHANCYSFRGETMASTYEDILRICEKAAFSSYQITEDEYLCVLNFVKQTQKLRRKRKRYSFIRE